MKHYLKGLVNGLILVVLILALVSGIYGCIYLINQLLFLMIKFHF